MRIGDWSSDVCSSDLSTVWPALPGAIVPTAVSLVISKATSAPVVADPSPSPVEVQYAKAAPAPARVRTAASASATLFLRRAEMVALRADRKSVVSGKSGSVRVALGGRRIIKKK